MNLPTVSSNWNAKPIVMYVKLRDSSSIFLLHKLIHCPFPIQQPALPCDMLAANVKSFQRATHNFHIHSLGGKRYLT